jgi:hypothetical protein
MPIEVTETSGNPMEEVKNALVRCPGIHIVCLAWRLDVLDYECQMRQLASQDLGCSYLETTEVEKKRNEDAFLSIGARSLVCGNRSVLRAMVYTNPMVPRGWEAHWMWVIETGPIVNLADNVSIIGRIRALKPPYPHRLIVQKGSSL